jgi:apolipoprotein N-acyltransferase
LEVTLNARRALAVLSGLLLWLSFPNPFALNFEAWPGALAWVALVPLLWGLSDETPGEAFKTGYLAGLACFVPGLFWLTNVHPLGPGAYPAWLALAAWCALFPGAIAALTAKGLNEAWDLPALWVPALWTLGELMREWLLSGFPWITLGSSQAQNPAVLPLAAALGLAGLHYAVALGNAIAFGLLVQPRWLTGRRRSASALAMTLLLAFLAQQQRAAQAAWDAGAAGRPKLKVAVVQGGIDLDQVWDQAFRTRVLDTYLAYSERAAQAGAQLIVWPESAFPGFFNEDAPEAQRLRAWVQAHKLSLLTGSTLSRGGIYQNGAVLIDAAGNTAYYAKRHLVPFGEYVPFRKIAPLLDLVLQQAGLIDFSPGEGPQRWSVEGLSLQPIICYESVFPLLVRQGAPVDAIALITVDTWYGHSAGPVWHAAQAQVRAAENGAWVARAATTGVSLFAAPDGRRLQSIPLDAAGLLVQELGPGRTTPFQRWGEFPTLAACLLLLLLAWRLRKTA